MKKIWAYKTATGSTIITRSMNAEQVASIREAFPSVKDFYEGEIVKDGSETINGLALLKTASTVDVNEINAMRKMASDAKAKCQKGSYEAIAKTLKPMGVILPAFSDK